MEIKELRLRLNLSQEELAHELGVVSGCISRWELGNSKPSRKSNQAIARLLKKAGIETEG